LTDDTRPDRFTEHQRKAGSAKTTRKAASSRQNLPNGGGRPTGALNKSVKPCLGPDHCPGGVHRQPCPVYRREAAARSREAKRKAAEQQ